MKKRQILDYNLVKKKSVVVGKKMVEKKMNKRWIGIALLFCLAIVFISTSMKGYNFEYVNVTSKVNVTNAFPVISRIVVDPNIILNAGSTKVVFCNVSAYDYNGWTDITNINATLWNNVSSTYTSADDLNNHYTNISCLNISQSGYYANYTCGFTVSYYAENGTWLCNATVIDSYNFTNSNINSSVVNALYAINVTPVVDYGEMLLSQTSENITANVTNFGNLPINVSVRGYGGTNPATGAGYSMLCQTGNITISNQRYSIDPADDWAAKTALSSTGANISALTVPKRTAGMVWNSTYWQLYTDPTNAPFGLCNGTIEFTAEIG